jgi:RNA polymerase sigma-70 factor (ECF subfamily)
MTTDDYQLFLLVKQNDKAAFDNIFKKYYIQLCRFAYRFLFSQQLAEEIVQDVFVRLWQQKDQINISNSLLAYLYTSVRNQSLNEIKKNRIHSYHIAESYKNQSLTDEINQENNDSEHLKKALDEACRSLPPKCREVFELSRKDGLTYEEIAEYLAISKKTVENQMGIAFHKLRQKLKPLLHLLGFIFLIFSFWGIYWLHLS